MTLKLEYTKNNDGTKVEYYRCSVCKKTFASDTSSAERNYHEEHCFPGGYLKSAESLVGKYFIGSKAFAIFSCAITYGFKIIEVNDEEIRVDVVGDGITGPYIKFGDTISYDDMRHSNEVDRKTYAEFITEKLDGWKFRLCPWLVPEKTEEEKYADKYIPKGRLKGTEHSISSPIKRVECDSDFDYLVRNLNKMLETDGQTSISFVIYKNVYEIDAYGQEVLITHKPSEPFEMSIKCTDGNTGNIRFDSFTQHTRGWTWLELDKSDYQIQYGCVLIKEINGIKADDLRAQYRVKKESE